MENDRPRHQEVVESTRETDETMAPQRVPVNVYETSGALVVLAPLPAVTATDVTVELRNQVLRFYAHVRSAGRREFLVHEWEYGGYEREVDIPSGYGSALEATLQNGQLAIRVVKGEPPSELIVAKPAGANLHP
jgi:HSP20 family molecular chaperone IbpA